MQSPHHGGGAPGLRPNISLGLRPRSTDPSTGQSPQLGSVQKTLQKLQADCNRGSPWSEGTTPQRLQADGSQGIPWSEGTTLQKVQADGNRSNAWSEGTFGRPTSALSPSERAALSRRKSAQSQMQNHAEPYGLANGMTKLPQTPGSSPSEVNKSPQTPTKMPQTTASSPSKDSLYPVATPGVQSVSQEDVLKIFQKFLSEADYARSLWDETQRVREHAEHLLRLNGQVQISSLAEELHSVKKDITCLSEAMQGGVLQNQNQGANEEMVEELKEIRVEMERMNQLTKKLSNDSAGLQDSVQAVSSVVNNYCLNVDTIVQKQPSAQDLRDLLHEELVSVQVNVHGIVHDELANMSSTLLAPILEHMQHDLEKLKGNSMKSNVVDTFKSYQQRAEEKNNKVQEQLSSQAQQQIKDLHESVTSLKEVQASSMTATSEKLEELSKLVASLPSAMGPDPKVEETSLKLERLITWTARIDEELNREARQLLEAKQQRMEIIALIEGSTEAGRMAQFKKLQERIKELEAALEMAGVNLLRSIAEIEQHGNVTINMKTGDVTVVKDIAFVAKKPGQQPKAQFANEKDADEVLSDIAAVWSHFPIEMRVEGHTKGGEDLFWQTLADNRASLIVEALHKKSVDYSKMIPIGLPGKKGLNKVGVHVNLDIFPDFD